MKSQSKHKKIPLTLFLLAFLVLAPAAIAASISTDQEDYAPWEIVTINGSGFEPASEMTVTVEWPDGYADEFYGTADDSGGFTLTYGKEKYEGTFIVYCLRLSFPDFKQAESESFRSAGFAIPANTSYVFEKSFRTPA